MLELGVVPVRLGTKPCTRPDIRSLDIRDPAERDLLRNRGRGRKATARVGFRSGEATAALSTFSATCHDYTGGVLSGLSTAAACGCAPGKTSAWTGEESLALDAAGRGGVATAMPFPVEWRGKAVAATRAPAT